MLKIYVEKKVGVIEEVYNHEVAPTYEHIIIEWTELSCPETDECCCSRASWGFIRPGSYLYLKPLRLHLYWCNSCQYLAHTQNSGVIQFSYANELRLKLRKSFYRTAVGRCRLFLWILIYFSCMHSDSAFLVNFNLRLFQMIIMLVTCEHPVTKLTSVPVSHCSEAKEFAFPYC
jgi:hypothetical protein